MFTIISRIPNDCAKGLSPKNGLPQDPQNVASTNNSARVSRRGHCDHHGDGDEVGGRHGGAFVQEGGA